MRQRFAYSLPRLDYSLVGMLLLALALRFWGLDWGLPSATHYFSYHPDESVVLETSSLTMNVFAGHLLPHFYHYGSLQLYLVCFANTLAALFGGVDIVPKDFTVWYPEWAKMYLVGRCLTVGMGVGTVWTAYALGRHLWGRRAGLLAGLTLALMPLHAQHSHFLTVDVPATFWAMLSLFWAVHLGTGEAKPLRAALWAGVFAGLAAATKYNLALMLLPLAVACVVRGTGEKAPGEEPTRLVPRPPPEAGGTGGFGQRTSFSSRFGGSTRSEGRAQGEGGSLRRGLLFLSALAVFILAFLLACPGAVLESGIFWQDVHFEAVHVQNADDPTFRNTGNGFVYHVVRNLDAGLGLPLLLLSLASVGYALWRRERGDGLLAAFALPYYILIGLAAVRYARYDIPLLPILALWNGRFLADGYGSSIPRLRENVKWAAAAVLLLTLYYTTLLIGPMAGVDARDAALRRINASPNTYIGPAPLLALKSQYQYPLVGFAAQPWFGTPPVSPYFSMPRPGGWREATSPELMRRIVYSGRDWDVNLLTAKKPDVVLLSQFDYDDPLRLQDPNALRYLQALHQDYGAQYVDIFPFNPIILFNALSAYGYSLPEQGLPHDMLYTNPYIIIYQRKTSQSP